MDFISRTMTISEFASAADIPVATVRDWNKREMAVGIGQPGPNGYWLYCPADVLALTLAKQFKASGFPWGDALWMGHIVREYLLSGRDVKHLVFYRDTQSERFAFEGADALPESLVKAVNNAMEGAARPVVHIVDLARTYLELPRQYQDGLRRASDWVSSLGRNG